MQNTGNKSGQHASKESAQHCHPYIRAVRHHNDAHRTAGRHRTIDGQVGQIEHLKGDEYADRHQSPDQTLRHCTGKCGKQAREKAHLNSPKQ